MDTIAKTWREVRDLLNGADDKHLDQPITFLGESMHRVGSIKVLSEDNYDDGECISSESDLADDYEKDAEPLYRKGAFIADPDPIVTP